MIKKAAYKTSVSEFTLNQADLVVENIQRNSANTNPTPKNQITYEAVSQLLQSKAIQNNDYESNDQPKLSHRQSRGGLDFFKRRGNPNLAQTKNHPMINENDIRSKDANYTQMNKRVSALQSIVNEQRHHVQQIDKRSLQQNMVYQKKLQQMQNSLKSTLHKIINQIKHKIMSSDNVMEVLRNDIESLKVGGVLQSIPNIPTVGSIKPKEKEREIIYGLDVKSSIDGIRYHHPTDNLEQINEMKSQIDTLREEINKQDKDKSKQQYQKFMNQFQSLSVIVNSRTQQKIGQCERVLKDHDENIQRINLEFQRVINEQISPRILGIQESVRLLPESIGKYDSFKKIIEECTVVKNELQERLKGSEVITVKKATGFESDVLKRVDGLDMNDTYFLDEEGYLMDCRGSYILGEDGKRVKIQESQIYFLNSHGISIMNIQ